MLATTELRRKHQNHSTGFAITARHLAEFLQSVEAEETLLTQRLRDREHRVIRSEATTQAANVDPVGDHRAPVGLPVNFVCALDDGTIDEVYGEF